MEEINYGILMRKAKQDGDINQQEKLCREILARSEATCRDFAIIIVNGVGKQKSEAWERFKAGNINRWWDLYFIISRRQGKLEDTACELLFESPATAWHFCHIIVCADKKWHKRAWREATLRGMDIYDLFYLVGFADFKIASLAWREILSMELDFIDLRQAFCFADSSQLKREIAEYLLKHYAKDWVTLGYISSYHPDETARDEAKSRQDKLRISKN
ncbi:MAG: hypothetical protein COU81_00590 [Candidatus Portnoybacteria bacterium CG10_big_fil_rev_8_21_14_0_10_36_7]|uniref:Uncharacterized protein n=1 Tax=Candidatus Portnoybacteria bacterium CG10_big_fil_rev_8_21_14_0_10_36_7 TaxID=1974812 RepID=A0A2M8KEW7_9BACT|nr:MAG: hypothetical protein COU81_00590 [Candidatus Portnoybacteria bacterium CG10_big_fil_rev_8_21_14_0_10_36_7]